MTEFLPWFVANFWLPALVLFAVLEAAIWGTVLAVAIKYRKRLWTS